MLKKLTYLILIFLFSLAYSQDMEYKNADLSISERVDILINQMTLKEKLAQTYCRHLYEDMIDEDGNLQLDEEIEETLPYGIGQLGKPNWAFSKGPQESAEITNKIQQKVIENNRFGIPAIFHEEALHGLWARGSTVFPQAIGMSCSWDPQMSEKIFNVIAKEIRTRGSHQANTPMLDVCRDPRWGRIEESYGEDPHLTSRFAAAIVKGLQGTEETINKDHIVATIKHFAGYGLTAGGLNQTPIFLNERRMREVVLPPFKAAVEEAGALSLMPAYNEIDGIPSHANHWLLKDLLRDEWNFQGYVVSDYGGVVQLSGFHPLASKEKEAGRIAMLAGVDMELDNPYCYSNMLESIENSSELQKALDRAVRNILSVKFKLGLFDDPYVDPDKAEKYNRKQGNIDLALKAAEESIVLLKNENDILPLDKSKYDKIAVIGPHANHVHYGGYSTKDTKNGITFYQGLKNYPGNEIEITQAEGCRIHKGSGHWLDGVDTYKPADPNKNEKRIQEAIELARASDLVILAVGGTAVTCGEFIGHRSSLGLFGMQDELVESIIDTGVPTIACLVNGRPLAINYLDENADAILETWYLGEQAGVALARTIFGEVNPGGKLTISFPKSAGHVPVYYSKKPSGEHTYLGEESSVLYPFGFGLSYTDFEYSNLAIEKSKIKIGEQVNLSLELKNTGQYKGKEIVQLYIRDMVSSVTRPIKELKNFKKVGLNPGQTKKVKFQLSSNDLKFYDKNMDYVLEPGEFEIMIGSSSQNIELKKSIRVVK